MACVNLAVLLLRGRTLAGGLASSGVIGLAAIAVLMLLSAYLPPLVWVQPLVFFIITPLSLFESSSSFYGLGLFAVGMLLLLKLDFFKRNRIVKASAVIIYLVAIEVFANLRLGQELYYAFTPVIFILGFLFFMFLVFRDKIFVYLKEPKAKLSLETKGLAGSEQIYIHAIVEGRSVKEIAFEYGVTESTVRNTIFRAYKKLGVNNRTELATLAEKYEIVE
jgi:DNA-binding CsgD family transcriptional regulator